MKGNFHVQFLGEGVAATSPPYPTPGWATTQVYPARCPPTPMPPRGGVTAVGCLEFFTFRRTDHDHDHYYPGKKVSLPCTY